MIYDNMNKYILDNLKKLNNNFLESGQHQATYCTLERVW
jgi:hypothetical protein